MREFGIFILLLFFSATIIQHAQAIDTVPLPEHPRPDFQRPVWLNLNGQWRFQFDPDNRGIDEGWYTATRSFEKEITVPFPWGSKLSGVSDEAVIGWYQRFIEIPPEWAGEQVFLVIGAADWHTTAWLNGIKVGEHRGGYTPFEMNLTPFMNPGTPQQLIIRVDDTEHSFKLYGKQGYGNARGIWQTVYLEARPAVHLTQLHFLPDIDRGTVMVKAMLNQPPARNMKLELAFATGGQKPMSKKWKRGRQSLEWTFRLDNMRLWSLYDPFLYELTAILSDGTSNWDKVSSYFGMRKISVANLPGTDTPYIALNNKPIYLQTTLDQAYHPDGFYTFPSDEFVRDEILRTRRLGLNGQRVHVKIEIPRKLYWADKLGVLIMADIPNSWGEPNADMRRETEYALRRMIERDFNHPSIFAWVLFNETWGLKTNKEYLPETQDWVAEMVALAKQLDPTRMVEDNSPNLHDHVVTDINSWHAYLPGRAWKKYLDQVEASTYPGSTWNFAEGYAQSNQPNLNSECGNVWGYRGSTGDVDWSWDYHWMLNEFRRHPKICGWLYTEHHDVINEWNGYYRYDRSNKITGLNDIVPSMRLNDLHSPVYLVVGDSLCRTSRPSERVDVPLWLSCMTDKLGDTRLIVKWDLVGWNSLGEHETYTEGQQPIQCKAWVSHAISPIPVRLPDHACLAVLRSYLTTTTGQVLQRNFTAFHVQADEEKQPDGMVLLRIAPDAFADASWSKKQWNVLNGLKVNGAGSGWFEYHLTWPAHIAPGTVTSAAFIMEASAKRLLDKDIACGDMSGDYMRGGGAHDPGRNPNAYPMTDEDSYPSAVRIYVNDIPAGVVDLPDDPADHRGILSWHYQPHDRTLHEAGSYGYLVNVTIPSEAIQRAAAAKMICIRLAVSDGLPHGLAIYGKNFGRYPLDPTIVLSVK